MSISDILDTYETDAKDRITKLKNDISKFLNPIVNFLYDDFKYIESFVIGQLSKNGKWKLEYTSSGYAKVDGNGLVMEPGGTSLSIYEGSVLVRSTRKWQNFKATVDITTEAQTYTKNAQGQTITPPGWQASWTLFRHVDKWRHWYFIIGLDHVEIGKKDAPTSITNQQEIEKYQYTLWTGGPKTSIGTRRRVIVEFIGNVLKFYLDGIWLVTLVDDGNLTSNGVKIKQSDWTTGEWGPYVEGARGRFQNLTIETK